jgi:hypothetical protein
LLDREELARADMLYFVDGTEAALTDFCDEFVLLESVDSQASHLKFDKRSLRTFALNS